MVTELPDDVFLADELPGIFRGFPIDGPGLKRLALGLGRDDGLGGVKGGPEVIMMAEPPGSSSWSASS